MKIYRRHNCHSQHRTTRAFIRCAIRRLAWVAGSGPYAAIAWCSVPTVTLWESVEQAENAMTTINSGCGHNCTRNHEIVEVRP